MGSRRLGSNLHAIGPPKMVRITSAARCTHGVPTIQRTKHFSRRSVDRVGMPFSSVGEKCAEPIFQLRRPEPRTQNPQPCRRSKTQHCDFCGWACSLPASFALLGVGQRRDSEVANQRGIFACRIALQRRPYSALFSAAPCGLSEVVLSEELKKDAGR
jgi:hypothetical protein